MVYAIYIAAALVIGLLIGFVILSINWLKKTVLRNMRSKTLGLLSVYDEILEEKSHALTEMEHRKKQATVQGSENNIHDIIHDGLTSQVRQAPVSLGVAERAWSTAYRESSITMVYHMIRRNFSFRVEEILPSLRDAGTMQIGVATRLLNEFDYDTIYHLSTLQSKEQVAILREVLKGEEAVLLEDYLAEGKQFHALEFYDSIRALADTEPKPVKVRLPADDWKGEKQIGGVEIILDDEICEGFQVEADHLLYDYCIKARELR